MKLILAIIAALFLAVSPVKANEDGLNLIFQGVTSLIHHHRHHYEEGPGPEDEGPPPDEETAGRPPPNANMGHRIIGWLEHHGEHLPLIVGRRDLDCAAAQERDFLGGWGVLLKRTAPDGKTVAKSGVVCVTSHGPNLVLDQ